MKLTPPYTAAEHAGTILKERGYAVVSPHGLSRLIGMEGVDDPLSPIAAHWNDLPADEHLRDGGRYRRRRHASYVVQDGALNEVPHRAHWQPLDYNALHGGIERWFKPLAPALVLDPLWPRLLVGLTHCAVELRGSEGPWHIEAHAFRIDTTDGIGRPTPEGAHRDGVDLVAVILLGREGIKGGETRVFDAQGPNGQRFTMAESGATLLIDDARAIHETTPIQPESDGVGHRDTLVLTWRLGAFQEPD